jgi:NADH-quinone oxidoreductase subunit D
VTSNLTQRDFLINMGPQHPATHGVFRLLLNIDGERVVSAQPHIGYLHRGSEKLAEGESFAQINTLFNRMDYISNFNMELSYVMAVEKLMAAEVPERGEFIRILLCELNRISSHMLFYGTIGVDLGAMTPIIYGFRERENIQAFFEAVSGARMMHNFFRIGGVKADLPEGFVPELKKFLPRLKTAIDECDDLLTNNEVFLERTKGVGAITAEQAIDAGMSGPSLRATGVAYDIRRAEPYSIYPRLQFDIPTAQNGDSWDRYWVRMEEMRQSVRILEQILDMIPEGPVSGRTRTVIRPPKGEAYVRTESPRGDFGVYIVTEGVKEMPYRLKVRAPSFCNLMTLDILLKDAYVADVVTVLGTLDIILGEVDR